MKRRTKVKGIQGATARAAEGKRTHRASPSLIYSINEAAN